MDGGSACGYPQDWVSRRKGAIAVVDFGPLVRKFSSVPEFFFLTYLFQCEIIPRLISFEIMLLKFLK